MDFHCDGKVNYSEFLAATISTINFNKEEKLWSAFKYFDTTDSGYITFDSVMDALKNSGVIIDEEALTQTFNELQKKGKKINFREFKAIALGKDEDEHEMINRKDSKIIDVEKNFNKLTSFKEKDSKEFPEVYNEYNSFYKNEITENKITEKKEEKINKLINKENDKKDEYDKSNNDKITNKEEIKDGENKEDKDENIYNQNKKQKIPILNEIKENINISNNAYNDIIINNSINKKNEKSKSKSNSKSNNKSNVDVLVEEHNNNDKYTDVHN
jgi:hypothetical protein